MEQDFFEPPSDFLPLALCKRIEILRIGVEALMEETHDEERC